MSSPFERAAIKASAAIDRTFAIPMRVTPMPRLDNYGKPLGAPDGRVPIALIGAFIERQPDVGFLAGDRQDVDFAARAVGLAAWASIDRRRFPDGFTPRRGDHIELLDRTPVARFEALDVIPDGPSRWGFALVRA